MKFPVYNKQLDCWHEIEIDLHRASQKYEACFYELLFKNLRLHSIKYFLYMLKTNKDPLNYYGLHRLDVAFNAYRTIIASI